MHFNSVMLDSDMDRVEGQKEVVYEPKVKILEKYSNIKNSDELLIWNEEMVLPLFCMIWLCE